MLHETLNSINHYEEIYENSENLSKVTLVYGMQIEIQIKIYIEMWVI